MDTLAKDIIPKNEEERLRALKRFEILYTAAEEAFDNITQMMALVFGTPMSFISLIDKDKVFYKSQVGPFGRNAVQRPDSLCSLTILGSEALIIEDASGENSLVDNPYVAAEGGIRFYAGAPLITKDGFRIGTACVVDTKTRTFSEGEKELLERFARMVMHEIELRQVSIQQVKIEEQLLASYKELQFVTDMMPQLVWATEPNGYSFYFNQGWLDYTALSFDEVKGDGWTKSLHPDDMEPTFNAWRNAVETGASYDIEYRLQRHDGMYRWFVARGIPMKDENGNILKWYGTSTDIHEQKRTQEVLQQSTERFALVSKATQDAIWDWNLVTDEIWWNEGFKELFGYKAEDIEPTIVSWYSRVHPDDTARVVGGIHNIIDSGGKQWADEYRFQKKDGSYAIVFDRGYALHDKEGKPYRMLGSMQDITRSHKQQEKIKESEERFEAAVAAVDGIVWTNNADGKMEGDQPGWRGLTGQKYEEYRGSGWSAAIHPDDAQPTIDAWNKALKERKTFSFEHRVKTKEMGCRLFSVRAIPLLEAGGSIREWVGVHTDITEQRLNEERIKQSEQRFQNLIREASVGIVVLTGEEMKVEVVNEAYSRLINRQVDELLNQPLFNIIPEAEEPFRAFLNNVRQSGQPSYLYDQPYRVDSKGAPIEGYLNIVYQPYKETDGTIIGVMVLCQDVTEQVVDRKKAEEAEETATLAITSAELGTFHVYLRTNQIKSSKRLDEIFDVADLTERSRYIEAIHPDDLLIRAKAYEIARKTGLLEYEGRVIRKNGIIRWFRVKGRMSFDDHHQPLEIVGVVMDITEEKLFSEELSRQVKERTQELEQFTYVSHHDLQEPLRKIVMYTEMVRSESYGALSETSKSRLDKVTKAARRMSTALKDVLNFASLSKQEFLTNVNLDEILATVQTDLELLILEKSAKIQSQELPTIKAIPQQMQQLFYNLLSNGLKFTRKDQQPVITISGRMLNDAEIKDHPDLSPAKQYYQLDVRDNGIGFQQQAAEKIFDLFQRLHNRDTYAGTGIGLALCKKVVTNHGGKIWAVSKEGEGATFTILLPAN